MGIGVGVAAVGKKGEVIFNHVADLEVPAVVKNSVEKAVAKTKKGVKTAAQTTAKTVGHGVKAAAKQVKSELSKVGAEMSQFGAIDIESNISPSEKSTIMNFLRDEARVRSGKHEMSDTPDAKGHTKVGGSASNGNINAVTKFMGGSAYLPTNGSTGVYIYLDDETKQISGFAASIKWKFN